MKARIALAGLFAAVIAAVAAPTAAHAGPNDNNSATVSGVTPVNATFADCPAGNFCLYTQPGYQGKMFKLYHCRTYSLANWNGNGSWWNNNTGGAHALIQDQNHRTLVNTAPYPGNYFDYEYNFKPAWFVKAC